MHNQNKQKEQHAGVQSEAARVLATRETPTSETEHQSTESNRITEEQTQKGCCAQDMSNE